MRRLEKSKYSPHNLFLSSVTMLVLPSKIILDPTDVAQIVYDPQAVLHIGYAQAQEYEVAVFAKEGRKLYAVTTNVYSQKIASFQTECHTQGLECIFFYTNAEGFAYCLGWYETLESQRRARESQRISELNAHGTDAISMIKKLYQKRDDWNTNDRIMEVVRLSYQAGASDVHMQAERESVVMRLRIDGVLTTILHIPHDVYFPYGKKLKFIAGTKMNIDYLPQDGRFSLSAKNTKGLTVSIDVRASFMPGIGDDNTVLRFLDSSQGVLAINQLGLNTTAYPIFCKSLETATGLILITGPTGSGKTTTLYAILAHKNTGTQKIITLEDPIEYQMPGIQQSQINYTKEYDYHTGLKACMRQDPDIILVGETRTPETAETVVNASLTGHLVFSTVHANSAIDAIPRMLSMDVKPYLLAPALQMIVAQRLVRKVCQHCETRRPPTDIERALLTDRTQGYRGEKILTDDVTIPDVHGCPQCQHIGYNGRIAIHEILHIGKKMKQAIIERKNDTEFHDIALATEGYMSMMHDGYEKMIAGLTTIGEIQRVLV